ncbi:CST complex subunit STN1 isoform X2 [Mixophyes fleayi]|uniref:CST complex subunit STN1 isoform X2 n=1 Tax=Mixophyes fleayi TaxID=3061075 RepID=UPI003F4E400C
MQPGSMEETPSLLWGLDPVFLAFAKLYIKDILELKESQQVPGIFFYNGHPIKQVDILGTVVCVREKELFYSYGEDPRSTSGAKDLAGLIEELYRQESKTSKLEIGDIIRVRGYIKIFRQQREVVASSFYKVDDPTLDMQVTRMLDLPYLYRNVYDKPFIVPDHMKDPSQLSDQAVLSRSSLVILLSDKVKAFLEENKICNFYQRELESVPSLLSAATDPSSKTENCSTVTSSSREIHILFKEAIHLLQERGFVYQKGQKRDVYQVTDHDTKLYKLTLNIIQEDCKRQKHADKGCHFLHILTCVQQSFGSSINETTLQRVIDALEKNSDIVSTMEKYYTTF